MNEKKKSKKNSKESYLGPVKKDGVLNNEEEFVIPNEGACSPEFSQGCILIEDEKH